MTSPRRFLIATWDGGGNTPAALNLGSRLARRGHRARMIGWQGMAGRAADAGIEFAPYRSERPWPAGLSLDDGWQDHADPLLRRLKAAAETGRPVAGIGLTYVRTPGPVGTDAPRQSEATRTEQP